MTPPSAALAMAFALMLLASVAAARGALHVGFYRGKCGNNDAEAIIRTVVQARFAKDRTIAAALMRLQFHDCFVKGCDASILLDGNSTEKTAGANGSVRGYDLIDEAKKALEAACPGVVSCADTIAAATRDAIAMAGGPKYNVQMGRRDGKVSRASDVDLPNPFMTVPQAIDAFKVKGLSTTDMVVLLGGHTVGVTHCAFVSSRLADFQGTGKPDPTMDPGLRANLRLRCLQNAGDDPPVDLDQNPKSANTVDNSYYKQISKKRGVLQIDQELALDPATRQTVADLAAGAAFLSKFGRAMVKLGAVGVRTGAHGQVRKNCRRIN